jgi:hypothetical protein
VREKKEMLKKTTYVEYSKKYSTVTQECGSTGPMNK